MAIPVSSAQAIRLTSRCWFAPEEMKAGRKLHEQIDEAIRLHDKLLLILSEHSMSSNWVHTEIANAREREAREKKQMLFPITLVPYEAIKMEVVRCRHRY